MGHTALVPEDELSTNKKKLVGLIDVALGGRASEEVFLGYDQVSTGCSSDLDKATNVAYQYVRSLAMNDDVSLISSDKKNLSDQFNFKIDMEVQNILKVLFFINFFVKKYRNRWKRLNKSYSNTRVWLIS